MNGSESGTYHLINMQVWENAAVRIRRERVNGSSWSWNVYRKVGEYGEGEKLAECESLDQAMEIGLTAAPADRSA